MNTPRGDIRAKQAENPLKLDVSRDFVFESDSSRTINYSYMFIPDILEHDITKAVLEGNQRTAYMYSRSISIEEAEYVTPQILAQTTSAGCSARISDGTVNENLREGVLPLSVALSKKTMDAFSFIQMKNGRTLKNLSVTNHLLQRMQESLCVSSLQELALVRWTSRDVS